MRRVGKDVTAAQRWDELAESYAGDIGGQYHAHRLRMVDRLMADTDWSSRSVVDFGCGDG